MARLPRLYLPGCAQHIIQRGNNRAACFSAHEDYTCYLHHLKEAAEKYQVAIHAFVLMTNHVHLLATPNNEKGISRMIQTLGRRYVQYYNYSYERTGRISRTGADKRKTKDIHALKIPINYKKLNIQNKPLFDCISN